MKKKLISWALVLALCLTLLPEMAFAADMSLLADCPYIGDRSGWSMPQAQAAAYANVLQGASGRLSAISKDHYIESSDQLDTYATLFDVNGSTFLWVCGIVIYDREYEWPLEIEWDSDHCYEVLMNEIWHWNGTDAVQVPAVKNYGTNITYVNLRADGLELFTNYGGTDVDGDAWNTFYPFSGGTVSAAPAWSRAWVWMYDYKLEETNISTAGKHKNTVVLEYMQKRMDEGTWIRFPLDWDAVTTDPLGDAYRASIYSGTGYRDLYDGNTYGAGGYSWPWIGECQNDSGVVLCAENITDQDGRWKAASSVASTLNSYANAKNKSGFSDVPDSSPFSDAVAWAVEQKITTGVTANSFQPSTTCTHNHILTFLWRSQDSPDAEGDNDFAKAINWAKSEGIADAEVNGYANCTRADAVTYLWKLASSPSVEDSVSFPDVPADASYATAVAWAVSKGITTGYSDGTFGPDNTCTRGQIVTFLYRAYA